jgi:hypothetical protein
VGYGPIREVRHFTDVATNRKSPVALTLEPDNEVLQIEIGQSGTVPRQSTGIFKIGNQHADYSACCLPQEKSRRAPNIMERNQTSLHQKQLDDQALTRTMNTIRSITTPIP